MRIGVKILAAILGFVAVIPIGRAAINESAPAADAAVDVSGDPPYSAIWVRNVFDLTPKPPPPAPQSTNAPPPNVKLVGIYTFGGRHAILAVQGSSRPGQPPAKEESYAMIEGDRRAGLEVLEIDPAGRTVKIKNEESTSTLAMETNTAGRSVAGMAQGAPGGGPHPFTVPPGFAAPNNPMNQTPGGVQLPPRGRQFGSAFAPQGAYGQANYYAGTGYSAGTAAATPGASAGLALPGAANNTAANNVAAQPGTPTDNTAQLLQALQGQAAATSGKLYPPPPPPSTPPPPLRSGCKHPRKIHFPGPQARWRSDSCG